MTQSGASVTYNLSHWPADSRDALRLLLDDAGIDVDWTAAAFSVPEARRADVDALVDYLHGAHRAGAPAPQSPQRRGRGGRWSRSCPLRGRHG